MRKVYLFINVCAISIPFLFYSQTQTQPRKFWSLGFNFGTVGWSPTSIQSSSVFNFHRMPNYGIGNAGDVNGKKSLIIIANTSLGVHGGFLWCGKEKAKQTGIYFEFQKNKACYSFKQPFSYSFKGDTVGLWINADNYYKYSIGFVRTLNFLMNDDLNPYYVKMSFGQTFHHRDFGQSQNVNEEEDWTEKGTGMKTKVLAANKTNNMISVELGKRHLVNNDNSFDIGIVYYQPFATSKIIEYEFFHSNTSYGKNVITYYGSTVMFNVTWNFNYKLRSKPVDSTKIISFDHLAVDTAKKEHHLSKFHHRVNGRKFEVQQTITTNNAQQTILIWDKNKVDGDEISLFLNGEPILENYTVSKTKKEIKIDLQPGSNIIVMHALNLGRIPPNTAALSVDDGTSKKKIITLVSDLDKSGALEVIYNP